MKADDRGGLDDLGRQPAGQSSLGPTLRDLTARGQEWAATWQLLPMRQRIGRLDTAFAPTALPVTRVADGNTAFSADRKDPRTACTPYSFCTPRTASVHRTSTAVQLCKLRLAPSRD